MKKYFKVLIGILIVSSLYAEEQKEIKFNNPKFSEPFANEYYANIADRLSAWIPVDSGLKAVLNIYIYSDGKFDYEILKESTSKEFNESLKAFLEKQKKIKYPVYKNRNIKLNVDFKSEG
ncbi:MAG: TonB C-terminal domain-containing protein [Candidatus Altimarinota bacterium]